MSKHLRVVASTIVPWIMRINDHECKKILCELIKYLSKSLNFTYNLIDPVHVKGNAKGRAITHIQRNVCLSWYFLVEFKHVHFNFYL